MKRKALRLLDANFNRAAEGLRVCEDILRFVYDDPRLTGCFKRLRHDVSKAVLEFPVPYREMVRHRNSHRDVGQESMILMKDPPGWEDLLVSNMKRSEEAFRVLEEASKLFSTHHPAHKFQKLRFELYELEKKVLRKF